MLQLNYELNTIDTQKFVIVKPLEYLQQHEKFKTSGYILFKHKSRMGLVFELFPTKTSRKQLARCVICSNDFLKEDEINRNFGLSSHYLIVYTLKCYFYNELWKWLF